MDMDFFQWHWWAGLAMLLMIAEIFVPGFFLFCLGIGCIGRQPHGAAWALGRGPTARFLGLLAHRLLHGPSHC
jgi:membrane protein implicated in regulation of membrane protease activity